MPRYAERADLATVGLSADIIADLDDATINSILDMRSKTIDGFLSGSGRYTMPIVSGGADLKLCCAVISAYDVMTLLGYNPSANEASANWRLRYEDQMSWLRDVAAGRVVPQDVVDSSVSTIENGIEVYTEPLRGW